MKTNLITRSILLILLSALMMIPLLGPKNPIFAQEITPEAPVTLLVNEDYQVYYFTFDTDKLAATKRQIQVYLPPGYNPEDKARRYPVIYFHDGELLFTPSGNRDCNFDETLTKMINAETIEPVIAVAIYSSDLRWDELGPWFNQNMGMWGGYRAGWHSSGEGDAYLDFVEDLKRYIDTYYNTDPGDTGIGGFSMGGLISLYAGLTRPQVFNRVMAMSPAIWFAQKNNDWSMDNHLLELIETKGTSIDQNVRFYMDIGTNEWAGDTLPEGMPGYPQVWEEGVDRVFNSLENYVERGNLHLVIEEGGVHEPYAWGGRFEVAMRWLYEGSPVNMAEFPNLRVFDPPQEVEILFTPTVAPTQNATATAETDEESPAISETDVHDQSDVNNNDLRPEDAEQQPENNLPQEKPNSLSFGWVIVVILFSAGIGLIVYVVARLILNKRNHQGE